MSDASRAVLVVPGALAGERIDRVVSFLTGLPRSEAAQAVDSGAVLIGGRPVTSRSKRVAEGDVLEVGLPAPARPPGPSGDVPFTVVHVDGAVIVVDKPAGVVVHPGAGNRDGTLVNGLLAKYPDMADYEWPDRSRPGIVHRIDKGTSGLLMVARNPTAAARLADQLEAHTVERRYLALVWGDVAQPRGSVDAPIGRSVADPTRMAVRADGRRAVTNYEVVERIAATPPVTLVRCQLQTGRTHQIRVHLAAIGHPVVGDERYRRRGAGIVTGRGPGRPFLHAAMLGFVHPDTGAAVQFESALPDDLAAVLAAFR